MKLAGRVNNIITQAAGTSKRCVLASLLERHAKSDGSYEDEDAMRDGAAGLYLGVFHFLNKHVCAELGHRWCRSGSFSRLFSMVFL